MQVVPTLDSDYRLEESSIEAFRKDGFVLLRGLASSEEVSFYRQSIAASTEEFAKSYKPLEERDTYGKAFIQNINIWERDEMVAKFTLARRFAKVAAELMGVKGVRIYHDQALYKEPQGGATP